MTLRNRVLTVGLAALSMIFFLGSPCGGGAPQAKSFAAGSIIIPMDNCFQYRDTGAVQWLADAGGQALCNTTKDDGIYRAYGLVYQLIKHGITVYWTIDPTKDTLTGPDVSLSSTSNVVNKWNWSNNTFDSSLFTANSLESISYIGGPFIIDSTQAATAISLITTDPDFTLFRNEQFVDMHQSTVAFSAAQVRPLVGNPPRIAILNMGTGVNPDVMVAYVQAAGLNWTCDGGLLADGGNGANWGDCGGGITGNGPCTPASIHKSYPTVTVNNGPGKLYDVLCENDFLPLADGGLPPLQTGGYALLWAPHWEAENTSTANQANLPRQIQAIGDFVDAGNNLFAECQGIISIEGGADGTNGYEPSNPSGEMQTDAGINDGGNTNGTNATNSGVKTFNPAQIGTPNLQVGDFIFTLGGGALTSWKPQSPSQYRPGVISLISDTSSGQDVMTASHKDNNPAEGAVVYLGGHNYSPTNIATWHDNTAGTRLVLNTLFNLGIPCISPNTACNTGLLGQCAAGTLVCNPSGGLVCRENQGPTAEICDGIDNNCNGQIDEDLTRGCYTGPAITVDAGVCHAGTQVCSNATWGACQGEVVPSPEICDGLDNDCNGLVDDGLTRACYDGPPGTEGDGVCVGGNQACTAGSWGTCNGEILPDTVSCYDGPPGTEDAGICHGGVQSCSTAGCVGEQPPRPSQCNGLDNNCDGVIDDGPCPNGYACTNGACVQSSCGGELGQCPTGYDCSNQGTCVPQDCAGADGGICSSGLVCSGSGTCVDPCASANCGPGTICSVGTCIPAGCYSTPCSGGQLCINGVCENDPCTGVTCPAGDFCRRGDCVPSCQYAQCTSDQHCTVDGFCETNCNPGCGDGQICDNGNCVTDPCSNIDCGGLICRDGICGDPICYDVQCPIGACQSDQCVGTVPLSDGGVTTTDGGPNTNPGSNTNGSGSGCGCTTTGGFEFIEMLGGLALLAARPRRRRLGALRSWFGRG